MKGAKIVEGKLHSGHYPQEENKTCDECGVKIGDYTIYKGKTCCVGCWVEFQANLDMNSKEIGN